MRSWWLWAGVLAVMLGMAAWTAVRLGVFVPVKVQAGYGGPYYTVYLEQRGSYQKAPDGMNKVLDFLDSQKMQPQAGFGLYLDDPRTVKPADLRARLGFLVSKEQMQLLERPATAAGLHTAVYPRQEGLQSDFPFKNALSIWIGLSKVYPRFSAELKRRSALGGPALEIYEPTLIHYFMPFSPAAA